jgi:hypothetical protein|tara:strand:+ start:1328 stop:1711 length:384 start_codon:yes stop_codon:yes gene_type:complete
MSTIKELLGTIGADASVQNAESHASFEAIMCDKLNSALDTRKMAVAAKTFNNGKLQEAAGNATIDIDLADPGDPDAKKAFKKFKVTAKVKGDTALLTGKKDDLVKFLKSDVYGMDAEEIAELFPELS